MYINASDFTVFIGKKIKEKRQKLGLVQRDLSKILGVSHQQVQKYENGSSPIPLLHIYKLSLFCETDINFFITDFDNNLLKVGRTDQEKLVSLLKNLSKELSYIVSFLEKSSSIRSKGL